MRLRRAASGSKGRISGSGSPARRAPKGDKEGGQGKSADCQELGEGARGRWQKAEPDFTFVIEGGKNGCCS